MEDLIFNSASHEIFFSHFPFADHTDYSVPNEDTFFIYMQNGPNVVRYLDFIKRLEPNFPQVLHIDYIENVDKNLNIGEHLVKLKGRHASKSTLPLPDGNKIGNTGVQITVKKYKYTIQTYYARHGHFLKEEAVPFSLLFDVFKMEMQGIKLESFGFGEVVADYLQNTYRFVNLQASSFNLMENFSNHHWDIDQNLILPSVWAYIALEFDNIANFTGVFSKEVMNRPITESKRPYQVKILNDFREYMNLKNDYYTLNKEPPTQDTDYIKMLAFVLFQFSRTYADYNELLYMNVRRQYTSDIKVITDANLADLTTSFNDAVADLVNTWGTLKSNMSTSTKQVRYASVGSYMRTVNRPFILAILMFLSMCSKLNKPKDITNAMLIVKTYFGYQDVNINKDILELLSRYDYQLIKDFMIYIAVRATVPNSCIGKLIFNSTVVDSKDKNDPNEWLPFNMDKNASNARPVDYKSQHEKDYGKYVDFMIKLGDHLTKEDGKVIKSITTDLKNTRLANWLMSLLYQESEDKTDASYDSKNIKKITIEDAERLTLNYSS